MTVEEEILVQMKQLLYNAIAAFMDCANPVSPGSEVEAGNGSKGLG